ncbi:MAG TPA: ABC transporter permease [Solirubrobacterales bacterium]|nr:ABC transporter permease [Solirubrobacterales bacterium]
MAEESIAATGPAGDSPWRLALRRLRRNRVALGFLGLFVLIVVFVLAAPLWADNVAETGPNKTHTLQKIEVDGEKRDVVNPEGKPIGPVWFGAGGKFFLGADSRLGRDEMVRLMYGGRTSLFIGIVSALLTTILATLLGLLSGYYRGWTDTAISRALDVVWAFPVLLLAIALGLVLAVGGLQIGPLHISGGSIWIPILIIGFVSIPYMARPLRGEVLALREKEFVEAAVAQGAGSLRIMFGELLPNLWSTIIVFFTLNIAANMLLESALSFLGVGVQAPNASWGTMIATGQNLITSAPLLTIIPGTMILLTVLSLNVFGDGLRDALDPRSKVRFEAHSGLSAPEGAETIEGLAP